MKNNLSLAISTFFSGPKTTGAFVFVGLTIFTLYFTLMNLKFWNSMILRNDVVVERPIELDSLSLRMARESDRYGEGGRRDRDM